MSNPQCNGPYCKQGAVFGASDGGVYCSNMCHNWRADRNEAAALRELLADADCRNCDGSGSVVVMGSGHGCDGTDEMCARTCPIPIPEQEQCQWCHEREAALSVEGEA